MPEWDVATLTPREAYRFLVGAVVPRPIAWTSTVSADGELNLAPFSYFNAFSSAPVILGLGIGRRDGAPKDTLRNILDTGEFVVNLVTEDVAEQMNLTAGGHPHGVSEFEVAGVTPEKSQQVRPPRVAESPVSFECVLYDTVEMRESKARGGEQLTDNWGTLVMGEVVHIRARDDLFDADGYVDVAKFAPVARLGGPQYWRDGEIFRMQRPRVDPDA